jgi:hypothetical protein
MELDPRNSGQKVVYRSSQTRTLRSGQVVFCLLVVGLLLVGGWLSYEWSSTNFPGLPGAKTERFFLALTALGTVFLGLGTF